MPKVLDPPTSSLRAGTATSPALLARVALTLNSSLEIWEVLKGLARITVEETGAERSSVFLLEAEELRPYVSTARVTDKDLWQAFRAMPPIPVADIRVWSQLQAGQIVVIEDAPSSELVPEGWLRRFSVASVALVPLTAEEGLLGLMTVDYRSRHSFTSDELSLLESIGTYAGLAVRNAQLHARTKRRLELQEGLARAAAALVSPLDRQTLAGRLIDGFRELFNPHLCAIAVAGPDDEKVEAVASFGLDETKRSVPTSVVPERLLAHLRAEWWQGQPLELRDDPWLREFFDGTPDSDSWYLILPLPADPDIRGAVVLGLPGAVTLDEEERAVALAFTDIAAASLQRDFLAGKVARQLRNMEVIHGLGSALPRKPHAGALVERLNELVDGDEVRVTALVFRDKSIGRRLGGAVPLPEERRSWRHGQPVELAGDGGHRSFPMRVGTRVMGSLRVASTNLAQEEHSFLRTLANSVGGVASRVAAQAEAEEADRGRVIAAERGRIASELQDTVSELFTAIGIMARREAGLLPSGSPWTDRFVFLAELADRGRGEMYRAVQALAFFPEGGRGLKEALEALARSVESESGIQVLVDTYGETRQPAASVERALYRVAHEALANAARRARSSVIRIELKVDEDEVVLSVSDDGIGPLSTATGDESEVSLVAMRRAVEEIGGKLRISTVKPHGTRVEARHKRGE